MVEWLKDAAGPGKLDSSEQSLKSVLLGGKMGNLLTSFLGSYRGTLSPKP